MATDSVTFGVAHCTLTLPRYAAAALSATIKHHHVRCTGTTQMSVRCTTPARPNVSMPNHCVERRSAAYATSTESRGRARRSPRLPRARHPCERPQMRGTCATSAIKKRSSCCHTRSRRATRAKCCAHSSSSPWRRASRSATCSRIRPSSTRACSSDLDYLSTSARRVHPCVILSVHRVCH